MISLALGVATYVVFQNLIVFQILRAKHEGTLTVDQMTKKYRYCLPLLCHLGIVGDFVYISLLLAIIVCSYSSTWRADWFAVAIGIGIAVSAGLHRLYMTGTMPESHVIDHQLTRVGWGHAFYMAGTLAIVIQFYCFTPRPVDHIFLLITSLFLAFHVVAGTHVPLSIYAPPYYNGETHKQAGTWITILVVWAILGGATWRMWV